MAKGNFEACATVTLGYEGGYSSNPKDPGNWTGGKVGSGVLKGTNMGIAANTYPNLDIKNLTRADVLPLYKARYWDGIQGDALPFGIDLATYDYGVNSGPSRGVKALQAAVGASVDGKVGADTIISAGKAASDGKRVIQTMCASRMSFLRGLSIWETFKRGWSSRVANVEAKAVAMWMAKGGALAGPDKTALQGEADKAGNVADQQAKASNGTTIGGTTVGGGDILVNGSPNWYLIAGIAVAVIVVAGVLYLKSRHNNERAKAYQAVAA